MSKVVLRHTGQRAALVMGTVAVAIAAFVLLRPSPPRDQANYVVASIAPLADIVREVAGDRFFVRTLLPPGASPHTFEPTPGDMVLLSKARAFFRIGLALELWADKLVPGTQSTELRVVTVSNGIEVIPVGDEEHHHHERGDRHQSAEDHADIDANPHIWLDPLLAARIADNVRDGLISVDPEHRAEYETRASTYVEKLKQLDEKYRRTLVHVQSRRLVVFHNAYAYLARRYGLEIVGVIEESPGNEPSARHIAALVDSIRLLNARAVLVEPQFNQRLDEAIAKDAGVIVVTIDPLGSDARPETVTYIGLMESNLQRLIDALGRGGP